MKGSKKYKSVTDMVRDLATDQAQAKELEQHLNKRNIVDFLFGLRCSKDVSQKQIADRLKCSQSRISKLENGEDDDLRLGDLQQYLDAIGLDLRLVICKKNWKAMDEVKFHALQIHRCLRAMCRIAKTDEQIAKGVSEAHLETLVNVIDIVLDSAKTLPNFNQKFPQIVEAQTDNGITDELPDQACEAVPV